MSLLKDVNLWVSLGTFSLGLFMVIQANRYPLIPGRFPILLGYLLMLASLIVLLGILMDKREEEKPQKKEGDLFHLALLVLVCIIGWVFVVKWLGFITTSTLFVLLVSMILGTTFRKALGLSVAIFILFFVGFNLLLGMGLPPGLLP